MTKRVFLFLFLAALVSVFISSGSMARVLRDDAKDGEKQGDEYGAKDEKDDDADLDATDLARICFVRKEGGRELVFLRVPPGMYRAAEARSKAKLGIGVVRVKLRPRHYQAIEAAVGKRPHKAILRISRSRLREDKGLKGHYVVRPLDKFVKELDAGEVGED